MKPRNLFSLTVCAAITAAAIYSNALATDDFAGVTESRTTTTTIATPPTQTVIVNETTIYGQQLASFLKDRRDATRYYNLLATSGLGTTLNDTKGYTVFVPVDSAWAGLPTGSTTPGVVDPAARAFLQKTIVSGKYDTKLMHGDRDNVTTLSGDRITIGKGQIGSYYANGVRIVDTLKNEDAIIYFVESPVVK